MKRTFIILIILSLLVSPALLQTKVVIKQADGKTIEHFDDVEEYILHAEDAEGDSVVKKVIIHKTPHGTDYTVDIDTDVLMLPEGLDGDSVKALVKIKEHHHPRKVARVVIKKSGFFRKNKIVIDFDPGSNTITNVTDNGEEVPESKYHKYQDYLEDATEMSDLESLHPLMEEVEMKVELATLADSEKVAELEELILELEHLESGHATRKKEHYMSIKKVIELEQLVEGIQSIYEGAGLTPPQKIKDITIKNGEFYVNEERVAEVIEEKCLKYYAETSGLDMNAIDSEELTIHIQF